MWLQKPARRVPGWIKVIAFLVSLGLLTGVGGFVFVTEWPDLAAQNIDSLRNLIGDTAVAQLEAAVLGLQDHAQQLEYQAGWVQPAAPWADSGVADTVPASPFSGSANLAATPQSEAPVQAFSPKSSNSPLADSLPGTSWQPRALTPLGTLSGEGQWQPYLSSAQNQAVAYRTFLQPDPQRPYVTVAIVAFNLQATRLHFVLGTQEPISLTPQPNAAAARTGKIPVNDAQPGVLLAAFNGGFKARHGYYGAMADGLTALPPIEGLATVAIYNPGRVRIGIWGKDINDSPDLVAWRQNGAMLIHNAQVNPDTAQTNTDWGLTVNGAALTWRSALALSADGQTLYYIAGPKIDVATLTKVVAQTGATQAMQLDINSFWVNFAAMRAKGPRVSAEPLLPGMAQQPDRYLKGYSRDFFYITAAPQSAPHG